MLCKERLFPRGNENPLQSVKREVVGADVSAGAFLQAPQQISTAGLWHDVASTL